MGDIILCGERAMRLPRLRLAMTNKKVAMTKEKTAMVPPLSLRGTRCRSNLAMRLPRFARNDRGKSSQ